MKSIVYMAVLFSLSATSYAYDDSSAGVQFSVTQKGSESDTTGSGNGTNGGGTNPIRKPGFYSS